MQNRIKFHRKMFGLTQQELADRTNTTLNTINKLENGRQPLTVRWLQRIGAALDVPWKDLVDDAEALFGDEAVDPPTVTADPEPAEPVDLVQLAETALPNVATVDMFTVHGDALKPCGILDGDHLMIDRGAKPSRDDIVVIELLGARRKAERIARVYDPPYLISYSLHPDERRPILLDDAHVKIIGVVRGVLRL